MAKKKPTQTREEKVRSFSYALGAFQKAMTDHNEFMKTVQQCINRKKIVETNDQGLSKENKQQQLSQLDKYQQEHQVKADLQMNQAGELLNMIKNSLSD